MLYLNNILIYVAHFDMFLYFKVHAVDNHINTIYTFYLKLLNKSEYAIWYLLTKSMFFAIQNTD